MGKADRALSVRLNATSRCPSDCPRTITDHANFRPAGAVEDEQVVGFVTDSHGPALGEFDLDATADGAQCVVSHGRCRIEINRTCKLR